MWPDIFENDAFSLVTLTAVINKEDHLPGRVGALAFNGVAEGISTTTAMFEELHETFHLIPSSGRGTSAPQEGRDKGRVQAVKIPHFQDEDTITADEVQNVRELGSNNQLRGVRSVIERQMRKINKSFDLTMEHLRLGALKGLVVDSNSVTLANLYSLFNVTQPSDIDFSGVFISKDAQDAKLISLRTYCNRVVRRMKKGLKFGGGLPSTAKVWALCGDNFFDALVSCGGVQNTVLGYAAAKQSLGANYAHGVFEFGDIFWENYQGTDDGSTVSIDTNECRFFLTGVPGLYEEWFAPGDFMETTNTIGLPRYAKIVPVDNLNRAAKLHVQSNPLPICTRPGTLFRGFWDVPTEFDGEGTTEG